MALASSRSLIAALAALTAVACGADKATPSCPSGQTFCGGTCRDPASFQTDPDHCGACGVRCGTGTCAGGVCQCEGATFCATQNPRCADTQNDPANCNGCGLACTEPGAGCQGGVCGCYAPRPNDCGGGALCTSWLTDPANCGTTVAACGHVCPLTNDECADGTCRCPTSLPTTCGSTCVNTLTDRLHCGLDESACTHACPLANDVCKDGTCQCPATAATPCPTAAPTRCVDLGSDEQNCGACGNVCATGATCTSENCACPSGQEVCAGACVSTQTDPQHCGDCATTCPASATCSSGTCHCPAGPQAGCGGACCAGGDACCGAACATQHTNGLGGSNGGLFYDCNATHAASATTKTAALAAADAWEGGITYDGTVCDPFCIARQTASACAVWCYVGSSMAGRAKAVGSLACVGACPYADYVPWY